MSKAKRYHESNCTIYHSVNESTHERSASVHGYVSGSSRALSQLNLPEVYVTCMSYLARV